MITTFIPCHNHGQYVREAIASVLSQTAQPNQLILLNDGSTDDTHHVFNSYLSNFEGFEIVHWKPGKGHIAAYNYGIEKATQPYFHLMAADDVLLDPTFYETAIRRLEEDVRVGFVTIGLKWMTTDGTSHVSVGPEEGYMEPQKALYSLTQKGNWINGGGTVVRTAIQRDFPYDPGYPYSADLVNWIRILGTGLGVNVIQRIGYGYRRHAGQMTATMRASMEERQRLSLELDTSYRRVSRV